MDSFEDIFYLDCPHFTVGRVDQWGEQGYLLHEGKVYAYEEDRKNQCGRTYAPMRVDEFVAYAHVQRIQIPEEFTEKVKEVKR